MGKFLLLGVVYLLAFAAVYAQGTVTGVVTSSEAAQPIPGVTVRVQ